MNEFEKELSNNSYQYALISGAIFIVETICVSLLVYIFWNYVMVEYFNALKINMISCLKVSVIINLMKYSLKLIDFYIDNKYNAIKSISVILISFIYMFLIFQIMMMYFI